MIDIVILSAGGTGRELQALLALSNDYNFKGFLDDNSTHKDVIGGISGLSNYANQGIKLISGLGSYHSMERRKNILSSIDTDYFCSYISPQSTIYPGALISNGSVVFPNSILSSNTEVGTLCLIYHSCVISHDCKLSEMCIISNGAVISGNVNIGNNSYIGAGSTILEGINIGQSCIVAAGATVIHDVPDNHIYIAPGKIKRNTYLENNKI